MDGRAKSATIVLVVIILCMLALSAGLSWYVNSSRGRSLLLKSVNAMIPGTLTASHHRISLLTGELSIGDLTVENQQGEKLAGFDSLFINLSLVSIFRKSLVVEAMDVNRPWLHLNLDENGKLNIVDALVVEKGHKKKSSAPDDGPPFNIVLNQFSLSEGRLRFSTAVSGEGLVLENVNIAANGNLRDESGVLKLSVGKSRMAYQGHRSDFRRMDIALALNNGHIEPLVIETENEFASLRLYGDIHRVFSDPKLDLNLDIDLSLGAAESFFGFSPGDTGRVEVNLNAKGRAKNPRLSLKAGYGGGLIAGRAVEHMVLLSNLNNRVATIERFSVDTGFGSLGFAGLIDLRNVFPQGFFSPLTGWENASCEGRLHAAGFDLASIDLEKENVQGKLDAWLNFKGQGIALQTLTAEATAALTIEKFSSEHMSQSVRIRSSAAGGLRDGVLHLDVFEADADGTHVFAAGNMMIDTEQIDAQIRLETNEVASLLSHFGIAWINGAISLDGKVTGRPGNPVIQISAAGEAVRIQDIDIGDVRLQAGVDEAGTLNVASLNIENRGSSVKARGEMQLFSAPYRLHKELPLSAELVFSNLEYNDFLGKGNRGGSLEGNLVLAGNIRSLKASADVEAEGIELGGVRLGKVAGKARFSDGKLFVDSLHLTNNRTDLKAEGELELFNQGSWEAIENPAFRLILSDGRVFMEDFDSRLKGELILDADMGGLLKQPRGRVFLSGKDLDLGMQRVESVTVDVKAEGRNVTAESFDIVFPDGGRIGGSGRIGYDKSFEFHLRSRDLSADSIDRVREMKLVRGKLALDISGDGWLHQPEIRGKAELKEIRVRDEAVDDAIVHFILKNNHVSLRGKHTFDLDAGYDLLSKAFFMELMLNDTGLAPWFAIAGRPEIGGKINGRVKAEGYADALERTRAVFEIRRIDIDFKGEHFARAEDFKGTFDNRLFEIPGLHVELLEQGHFFMKGGGDINGSVNLEVVGDIPLRAANLFAPNLSQLEGTLSLMASVGGSFQKPALSGEIRIEQGGMVIPELQQRLHSLKGRVVLNNSDDIIGNFGGRLDDGRFDVEAAIKLDGFRPGRMDARVKATALPFQMPHTMEMLLNADLSISGVPDRLLVGGEVVLLEGSYYKDFKLNLLQSIQEKEREETHQSTATPYPYLKPLRFNIHFKHRRPFLVENNIADLEISPDIVLTGTPNNPIITGSAKVDNGIITYQNRSFVVQRGGVDFTNPYKTEAEIDIKGEVEIREWRIIISLYGPPDRLVVELSSFPPEEDADIISLLVFKKTTYELNEGKSGVSQSSTVLLAQLLASSFGDDIKGTTGIDILEVEAESAEDKDSTDRIKVTVGKDLSERMTVKYSVESKEGGYVQRASTEYQLSEHILVSGFQDTKGVYGGEFIFRIEFRLFR